MPIASPPAHIQGPTESGVTAIVGATTARVGTALNVAIKEPTAGDGGAIAHETRPLIEVDFTEGILSTDHDTIVGLGGSAGATGGMCFATSGTSPGGFSSVRSREAARFIAGSGIRFHFGARFSTPTTGTQQFAGALNAANGAAFRARGEDFGVMLRISGAVEIRTLTIDAGAAGAGNITLTLNSQSITIAAGGALSQTATASLIADALAALTGSGTAGEIAIYQTWIIPRVSPQTQSAKIILMQRVPGAASGTYSISGVSVTGTFAQVQAGTANDDDTLFYAQADWNIDKMDGTGPSGMTLVPTNLNNYRIALPSLRAGPVTFEIQTPCGEWQAVHTIEYAGAYTSPAMRQPTLRLVWAAAITSGATSVTVYGSDGSARRQGEAKTSRPPVEYSATFSGVGTEVVLFAVRVASVFADLPTVRQALAHTFNGACETANRTAIFRFVLNPTFSATPAWAYASSGRYALEVAAGGATITGGDGLGTRSATQGSSLDQELHEYDILLLPGDVLAVTVAALSSTVSGRGSLALFET